jgi:hypothetical protein
MEESPLLLTQVGVLLMPNSFLLAPARESPAHSILSVLFWSAPEVRRFLFLLFLFRLPAVFVCAFTRLGLR